MLKFYYFYNSLWDRLIPSSKSINNSLLERVVSNYLSEIDFALSQYILNILRNNWQEDISSESWGVDISDEYIFLYFLYDEGNKDYQARIHKSDLISLLEKWELFLQKEPVDGYEEMIGLVYL